MRTAENEHNNSQGDRYYGTGVEIDFKKAVEFYTLAANKGHALAQYNLAFCYLNGEGVEVNQKKAFELISQSAEQGHPPAQFNLGVCLENGTGVEANLNKAIEFYTLSAQNGHSRAQFQLGTCYENGRGVSIDMSKAVEFYEQAATQGLVDAQFNLALCYQNGKGVQKDFKKAAELFQLAADQGDAFAQNNLGMMYQRGIGVEMDAKKAEELFTLSAEQGNAAAKNNLGTHYHRIGKGDLRDLQISAEQFTQAAMENDPTALYNLGVYYQEGFAGEVDLKKAVYFYTTAANLGNSHAQNNLAFFYKDGIVVEKDEKKAVELLTLAANQGNSDALFHLGTCYGTGVGVPVDFIKAYEFFELSACKGNSKAQFALGKMWEKMKRDPTKVDVMLAIGMNPIREIRGNCSNIIEEERKALKQLIELDPTLLHKFKILKKLGQGGEGAVFLAEIAGNTCALKMISTYGALNKNVLENRYEREWTILERLESKNVISPLARFVTTPTKEMLGDISESIQENLGSMDHTGTFNFFPTQFFIFEYHPAGNLENKMKILRDNGGPDWNTIFKYSLDILEVLELLFTRNVVHNDVKMENVLVSSSDTLILSDFGCSFITRDHLATRKSLKSGNRFYKAPEIHNKLQVKNKEYINVTKQYSWEAGCLLFEIAFGVFPYIAKDGSPYPWGFEVPAEAEKVEGDARATKCTIKVSELTFPQTLPPENAEVVEKFLSLLLLLLQNDENERINIMDAHLLLQQIHQEWAEQYNR